MNAFKRTFTDNKDLIKTLFISFMGNLAHETWVEYFLTSPSKSVINASSEAIENAEIFGIDCNKEINVAFVGAVGVGKSTLINVLRGIKDDDPLAAKVGHKGAKSLSTTKSFDKYQYGDLPIQLVDTPGGNSEDTDIMKYLDALRAFDAIVVLYSVSLGTLDKQVIKKMSEFRKTVIVARTKFDKIKSKDKKDLDKKLKRYNNKFRTEYVDETIQHFCISARNLREASSPQFQNRIFAKAAVENMYYSRNEKN
jgi:small GTP-binding protein